MQIGNFIISEELLAILAGTIGFTVYYFIKMITPPLKTEVEYIDPESLQGRRYKAEDSMIQNSVTVIKTKGFRKKPEKLVFSRDYPPLIEFRGASRVNVYKIFHGSGGTSDWAEESKKTEDGGKPGTQPQTTHSTIGKFEALASTLVNATAQSGKAQFLFIILGVAVGLPTGMILSKLIPGL